MAVATLITLTHADFVVDLAAARVSLAVHHVGVILITLAHSDVVVDLAAAENILLSS